MIIHLPAPVFLANSDHARLVSEKLRLDGTNFHLSACDDTRGLNRAGCPSSVLSCTAWGFSCLANYSASGEPLPRLFTLACACSQRTGGMFSVTLSVNIRPAPRGTNIARVFYAACCRMVFGLSSSKSRQRVTHQRSSAIGREFSTKNPNLEARKPRMLRLMLDVEVGRAVLCAPRSLGHRRARSALPYRFRSVRLALLRMLAA